MKRGIEAPGSGLEAPPEWIWLHLGEEEATECGVLYSLSWNAQGSKVSKSLDLIDHSLGVGHLQAVFKLGLSVPANHPVNLLMDLGWRTRGIVFKTGNSEQVAQFKQGSVNDMHTDHSK